MISQAQATQITDIPEEVVLQIFSMLDPASEASVSEVSRDFRRIACDPHLTYTTVTLPAANNKIKNTLNQFCLNSASASSDGDIVSKARKIADSLPAKYEADPTWKNKAIKAKLNAYSILYRELSKTGSPEAAKYAKLFVKLYDQNESIATTNQKLMIKNMRQAAK